MSSPTLTIEEVEREFSIWRSNKKGQPTVPDALLHKVEILLKSNNYKNSNVLRRLGISKRQAKNKGLLPLSGIDHLSQGALTSFIKIPMPQAAINAVSQNPTTLILQRGDTQLSLNCPTYDQIQLIINTLLR